MEFSLWIYQKKQNKKTKTNLHVTHWKDYFHYVILLAIYQLCILQFSSFDSKGIIITKSNKIQTNQHVLSRC